MEERIDNETVQQIDLISMLKDIGREWLTILLLAIALHCLQISGFVRLISRNTELRQHLLLRQKV